MRQHPSAEKIVSVLLFWAFGGILGVFGANEG
jgi:hypothetical protein